MRLTRDLLEQLQETIEATDQALSASASIRSAKIMLSFGDADGEVEVEVEVGYNPSTEWTVMFR